VKGEVIDIQSLLNSARHALHITGMNDEATNIGIAKVIRFRKH